MELKSLDVQKGKIDYLINKGKSPCLVFVHGLGSNHSLWKPYIEYFGDYSAIALDLRGHGRSNAKLKSFDDFSEDVKKILDKENIKEIILIGSCLGVPVIIDFLKKYNQVVKKLVLIVPYGKGYARFSFLLRIFSEIMLFFGLFEKRKEKKEFFDYWDEKNLGVRFPFFKEYKIMSKKFYFNLLKTLLNKEVGFEYLDKDFLLLLGKTDFLVKNRKIKKRLRRNPYYKFKSIGTHHLATSRKPKTICKAIEEFIYAKHNNTNPE